MKMGIKFNETRTGRRYFTVNEPDKGFGPFTNGYIEITKGMPQNYSEEFYDQFNFWGGATYSGIVFPDLSGDDLPMIISPAIPDQVAGKYDYEHCMARLSDEGLRKLKNKPYFWVVGFDDNHFEKFGTDNVIRDTKRIAEEMDIVAGKMMEDSE